MGKLGETGAHRMLTDTARLRIADCRRVADLEMTQRMPVIDRRSRAREAQVMRHNTPGLPATLKIQAE